MPGWHEQLVLFFPNAIPQNQKILRLRPKDFHPHVELVGEFFDFVTETGKGFAIRQNRLTNG